LNNSTVLMGFPIFFVLLEINTRISTCIIAESNIPYLNIHIRYLFLVIKFSGPGAVGLVRAGARPALVATTASPY